MSERSTVKFTVPVSLMYDNARSSEADAVEDFFRAMAEAEQAGFFDRTIISMFLLSSRSSRRRISETGNI